MLVKYSRPLIIAILLVAGIAHFIFPEEFTPSVPKNLGDPYLWVYLTGVIEFLAAYGLTNKRLRLLTSNMLIIYFLALLPAHFEMVITNNPIFGIQDKTFFVFRVFLQIIPVFLAWHSRYGYERSFPRFFEHYDKSLTSKFKQKGGWLNQWILAAAFYNIGWGIWVVLFPDQSFRLFDMAAPSYLFIWQSVGMIVGVYGLGYYFLAMDIKKYYPLLLVGTLGKIFGPIGFIQHFTLGNIPLEFGTLLIFNDLIWWPSFFIATIKYFKDFYSDSITLR